MVIQSPNELMTTPFVEQPMAKAVGLLNIYKTLYNK